MGSEMTKEGKTMAKKLDLKVTWRLVRSGMGQTVTVDPRNGKTYLGHPVPTAFALRLGLPPETASKN
jgi:hypothetical protein